MNWRFTQPPPSIIFVFDFIGFLCKLTTASRYIPNPQSALKVSPHSLQWKNIRRGPHGFQSGPKPIFDSSDIASAPAKTRDRRSTARGR